MTVPDKLVGPRCPSCGSLGHHDDQSDTYECTSPGRHRFWAATRYCPCGDIPVCLVGGDVWVCINCGQWESIADGAA